MRAFISKRHILLAAAALGISCVQAFAQPTITTASLPQGTVGQQYSATLTATGGTPPYSWGVTGQLPPGLSLFSNGTISGTPTSNGTYTFTVSAGDSTHAVATKQFSIAIGSKQQVAVTTSVLPSGSVGQSYSTQLAAAGGTPPYQWAANNPPAGLSLSAAGVLSGVPSTAGAFQFAVQVTDSTNTSASAQMTITIQPGAIAITTVPPLFAGTVGTQYAQPFAASGGQTPYTWSVASGNTDGLTLNSATGILTGSPAAAGTFNFTIRVSDASGASASAPFSLVVNSPLLTITVGSSLPQATAGSAYSQKLPVQATGGTPPYTWQLTNSPLGWNLDSNTLVLSGVPSTGGTLSFTVQVTDSTGQTASKTLSLAVSAAKLSITTSTQLPDGTLNASYVQQMVATGGQPPYRWSANGLPSGLSINTSSGTISGTPTEAGTFGVAITVSDSALANVSDRFTLNINLPTVPAVTLAGIPSTIAPAQQYNLQISLGSAYPAPITGQAILTFSPNSGPADRTIQFSSGGTTANFNIPAGSTTPDAPLALQTGTVSGMLSISLRLQAGGVDITPSTAPTLSAQLPGAAPVITSTQVTRSGNTLNVIVTGYSTAREVTQAVYAFSATAGQTLQTAANSITIDVGSLFGNWFVDSGNSQFGSVFIFTQPFAIQGDVNAVIPTAVTLTNRTGSVTANVTQ